MTIDGVTWMTGKRAGYIVAAIGFFLSSGLPLANADFQFSNFSSTAGLNLIGAAASASNRLRLTPASPELSGAAWYTAKQNVASGFQSSFEFEMFGGDGASDGFAFLIQNTSATALFGAGARLGYGGFGNEVGGLPNSIALQFDTFPNGENNDPNGNYASVQSRGTLPNSTNHLYTLGQATIGVPINGGGVHHVEVNYSPGTLKVYFDHAASPLIQIPVNLATLLSLDNGQAFAGFTAGTGGGYQNHDILNWQFKSVPEPSTAALAFLGVAGATLAFLRRKPRSAARSS
jgi:hypothetical protein